MIIAKLYLAIIYESTCVLFILTKHVKCFFFFFTLSKSEKLFFLCFFFLPLKHWNFHFKEHLQKTVTGNLFQPTNLKKLQLPKKTNQKTLIWKWRPTQRGLFSLRSQPHRLNLDRRLYYWRFEGADREDWNRGSAL